MSAENNAIKQIKLVKALVWEQEKFGQVRLQSVCKKYVHSCIQGSNFNRKHHEDRVETVEESCKTYRAYRLASRHRTADGLYCDATSVRPHGCKQS